ncbi:MAG: adenylate/guanylate cyclase domain-containing protein [Pseudomonadota bacterium]
MNPSSAPAAGKTPPGRRISLRLTLVAALCGITVLAGAVLAIGTSTMVRDFMHEELRMRLADVVSVMASQIDVERHGRVATQADEPGEDYIALQTQLREMREKSVNVAYAYTMRRQPDGSTVFVIDSAGNAADLSHVGSPYTDLSPELAAALQAGPGVTVPFVEHALSRDPWGTWLSAFMPLYTADGRQDGVVGIDISAETVEAHQRRYQWVVWSVSIGLVLILLPLSFWMARRIRQPLATLAEEMDKVRRFELDSEVKVSSRITEIQNMSLQLENMKRGLRAFRKYVPNDLVRELIELGVDAEIGGRKEVLTVFFSDIANFTAMSENMPPDTLVRFMSEYLTTMNGSLLRHRATVDKYMGDGVMAFWGAPRPMADHALRACLAALDCQRDLDELSRRWDRQGVTFDCTTRIGIHTGEVVVGNIGSDERMNYTVIGGTVNSASRLEGINKYYGTRILITGDTLSHIAGGQSPDPFLTRLIDKAVLAGKTEAIGIHELVCRTEDATPALRELATRYDEAWALYGQRRFDEAGALFDALRAQYPDDRPAQLMAQRCRDYAVNPPPADWQGEFVFRRK